jgi:pentapeptide repeat protein
MIRSRGMPQVVPEVERRQSTEPTDLLLGADLPAVLRVAAELYARDRAQIERAAQRQELKQAAAEAGLPPEYLERAAVTLQAQRMARLQQQRSRWRGATAILSLFLAFAAGWVLPHPHHAQTPRPAPAPHVRSLAGLDLRGANFYHQDLAGRDLSLSNLSGAILARANLRGADLSGANLVGANLAGADLAGADLQGAIYNPDTRWPANFSPMAHKARLVRW